MGLEIPARNGLASNYQANNSYSAYYDMIDRVFTLNKWYAEVANETENVYFFDEIASFLGNNVDFAKINKKYLHFYSFIHTFDLVTENPP